MSISQRLLVHFAPEPNKPEWKVERFDWLSQEFSIREDQLPRFYAAASRCKRGWQIVRLLYGINPLVVPVDSDADYLKVWSKLEIAIKFGLDEDQFDAELSLVRLAWEKALRDEPPPATIAPAPSPKEEPKPKASKPAAAPKKEQPLRPPPKLPEVDSFPDDDDEDRYGGKGRKGTSLTVSNSELPTQSLQPLEDQEHANLMLKLGFPDSMFAANETVEAAIDERAFVLSKVLDYQRLFDEPMVRSLVQQAVINELLINRINREMLTIRTTSLRFSELQDTKKTIEKNYQEQWKEINRICPWAEQVSSKVNFAGVISDFVEAIQEKRAKGSNRKIDGLFTAYQLQIQLREAVQHPVRYRAGQVAALLEAMSPEALWDPNWKRSFSDNQCKMLDEGFRGAIKNLRENSGIPLPDLEDDGPRGEYPPLFTPAEETIEPEEPTDRVPIGG